MKQLDLKVGGMSCGHCVASVRSALESIEGVTVDQVSVGSATVHYDPSTTQPADVVTRVKAAGYDASVTS
jgi:copper chaperone CopZ